MGARHKLNLAYLHGCLILAALLGAAAHSATVFLTASALLVGGCIYSGAIRPRPRGR